MAKVYLKRVAAYADTAAVNRAAVVVLREVVADSGTPLEKFIPLKVHCGELGNKTYIEARNFDGIIAFLKEREIESAFIETTVLYKGQRKTRTEHLKTAREHDFTQLPLIIADGESGEDYAQVAINGKHFRHCKLGKEIVKYRQLLVLSHFKGHIIAGFGGAVKQLAMGCAAKGGKLAQHANAIPRINAWKCKACGACALKCPEKAITVGKRAKIDPARCVGCASCIGVCHYQAVTNSWLASLTRSFHERLAEYALAATVDKHHLYLNFALNITQHCDCEGHAMKPVAADLGVLASIDPVAIDQACLDLIDRAEGRKVFKKGRHTLEYAEKIGLGSRKYELVELCSTTPASDF